jgi:hypothetical protein
MTAARHVARRMKIAVVFGAAAGVLMLPIPGFAARRTDNSVPAALQQAFQLGYALNSPAADTEEFLQAVKDLKSIDDPGKSIAAIEKLATRAEALRKSEASAYLQTFQRLQAMGAPPALQMWARSQAQRLDGPLKYSKEARSSLPAHPQTAAILATIDEAQSAKEEANRQMPVLVAWAKVSSGGDGVWAMALGSLTAGMHAAVVSDRPLALSRTDATKLYHTAPFGTPPRVFDALSPLIVEDGGNLSSLIRLPAAQFSAKSLVGPQKALIDAYSADSLAARIDKGAQ